MLPSTLLVSRSRSGKITPVYVPLEESSLELSSRLIRTYEAYVGKRKGELAHELQRFEGIGVDYRLIRGLCALLDRVGVFEPRSHVDPKRARRAVFIEANRFALVATEETKQQVLTQAASRLGVSSEQLEASLWSDFEDELVLERFSPPSPRELLRQYNLSLTQTILFKAVALEFTAGSNYQRIFRQLKYLGLMYSVEQTKGRYHILVDGPVSLFKLTERYGTSLAKLLPSIVDADEWSLRASIVSGDRQTPKLLEFRLDSDAMEGLIATSGAQDARESFDSSVEASFARSFNSLRLGWKLKREPELLTAGKYVFIPDFGFEKNGMKAFLEVVGFWTDEYLRKKVEKLQKLDVENLLIAVDRSLNCAKFENVKGQLIFYDKKVPLKPIVDYLRKMEEKTIARQASTIDPTKFKLEGDVIVVSQLAEQQCVSSDAIVRWLTANPVAHYQLIGSVLVSAQKLGKIAEVLRALNGGTLSDALAVVAKQGMPSPEKVLAALGYAVEWRGLDPDAATIRKKKASVVADHPANHR